MNVLLVDDESYVIDYLLAAVEWEEAGIDEVFYAYSGPEALRILDDQKVDIVLTDVKMPGMSGLELIRKLEARKVKSIVLSGHADFEYAQQAMQHHAVNYLLKPARADEVLKVIVQVAEMIRAEWEEISSVQNAMRSLREHEPLLRQNFIRGLLRGQVPDSGMLRAKQAQIKLPLEQDDDCRLMVVRLDGEFGKFSNSAELLDFAIDNIAAELLGQQFEFLSGKDELGNRVYIVKPRGADSLSAENGIAGLEQTAGTLLDTVPEYLDGSISVLIGGSGKFPHDIPDMYEAALQKLRTHVKTKNSLLVSSEEAIGIKNHKQTVLEHLYAPPSLQHLLEAGHWDRCEDKLQVIMRDFEQREQVTAGHLMEAYHSIANAFFYIIHKSSKRPEEILGETVYRLDFSEIASSLSALQSWTIRTFHTIRESLEVDEWDERGQIAEKIHQYVESHLREDVSLQALADHVYLHPAYLSSIYKDLTGEGVSSYIYRRKMEHAADLLKRTSHKIAFIAEEVGYQNTSYFIRVFKKYYACTPQKYREQ
ncbi:response regulator [Paenibacillus sp. LHD-38]|uniref:response regulator n=1 Tax=Paenibacillus sp. LHD-38 TaxID=3072143 RepID=UPI0028100571|nr:response regulator [Paenibacillus sp. LHD-38]MDQ8734756.1 response regulator [Paenibacillus sp. LHD-38]